MTTKPLELLDWPDKTPLATSSRRSALTFPIRVKADVADLRPEQEVLVKSVKLAVGPGVKTGKDQTVAAYSASAGPLFLKGDGETATGDVSLRLDRNMPPGEYIASLEVAGVKRDVSFDVVADTSLRIRPSPVVIDAASANGVAVTVENRGNVPLPIDVRGKYPLGREEPLAADTSDTESVLAVLTAALNRAPRVLTEVGAVTIAMPDGSFTLAPGTTHNARITATWDMQLDPARRYRAFIPVFASELEIAIVTAIKPGAGKPAAPTGGKKKRS